MSRSDLDKIQARLKVAIQSHQMLVSKMRTDAQSPTLQKQLHELQSQITILSEKQKYIVQMLRKELVQKPSTASQVAPAAPCRVTPASPSLSAGRTGPAILPHSMPPCPKPLPLLAPKPATTPDPHQPTRQTKQGAAQKPSPHALQEKTMANNNNNNKPPTATVKTTPTDKGANLRVPNLPSHKPSILQGGTRHISSRHTNSSLVPLSARRGSQLDLASFQRSSLHKEDIPPEQRQKLEFMASLDLITQDTLKELQTRRSERKRRSTANPQFSYGHFEPESDRHEDYCAVCRRSGELLMCDTCSLVYHLACLDPPLSTVPQGLWSCPKCSTLSKQTGSQWSGTLALVHSYITHKAAKEEEKGKLNKKKSELKTENVHLETSVQKLKDSLALQLLKKKELVMTQASAQQSVDQLKNLMHVFQTL